MARARYAPASLKPKAKRAKTLHTVAPVKGLNTVDPLAQMSPEFAISCQNFIASPQGLEMRQGYRKWATGLPTTVTSLLPYNSGDTSQSKLFAVSGTAIYDITSGGAVGAASVSGLNSSNVYWQSASQTYSTNNKHYLFCVNGADYPQLYDGASWSACSQVASPSAPGQFKTVDNNGNSVNIQNFVDVLLHQQRLWFVNANSTKAYYTDIASAGGNLNFFDFGPFFSRGGTLLKLATWTINTGSASGTQPILVAISSKGDVVLYAGTNPAVSSTWSLLGAYQLGAPVGRRCTCPLAGDLLLLTQDGLYPLSKYLQTLNTDTQAALTYTISPTISNLVSTYATTPGFEMAVHPGDNILLLNVPQSVQTSNFQFVQNTLTQGWSTFSGWAAQCWGLFNNALYFGGANYVGLAFIGYVDGADINGAGGNNINASALQAFNHFEQDIGYGVQKHVKLVKPYLVCGSSTPAINVGVNTDYNLNTLVAATTARPATGAYWDSALWDAPTSVWAGTLTTYNQWATVSSYPGEAMAFAISVSAVADLIWASTSWVIEPGSQLG